MLLCMFLFTMARQMLAQLLEPFNRKSKYVATTENLKLLNNVSYVYMYISVTLSFYCYVLVSRVFCYYSLHHYMNDNGENYLVIYCN